MCKVKKIADTLEGDKKNKKTKTLVLNLRKFVDICEAAAALSQTGAMCMDMQEIYIAADLLVEGGYSLPVDLQIQVTERSCLDATDELRAGDPGDAEKAAADFVQLVEIWSLYGEAPGLQDDWDYRSPSYKSLLAMVSDNADGDEVTAQKQAWSAYPGNP